MGPIRPMVVTGFEGRECLVRIGSEAYSSFMRTRFLAGRERRGSRAVIT